MEEKKKNKKDLDKILLITLFALFACVIILIPFIFYAEVKKLLPIVAFIVIPLLLAAIIVLLSRNCLVEYNKKRKNIIKKIAAK